MQTTDQRPVLKQGELVVRERNRQFQRDIYTDKHHLLADEPESAHGTDQGFDPYELLMASLGACTSMTLRMYANHKGFPLESIEVYVRHDKVHEDDAAGVTHPLEQVTRIITLKGALSAEQRDRLLDVANKCPLYRTLTGQMRIGTTLSPEGAA